MKNTLNNAIGEYAQSIGLIDGSNENRNSRLKGKAEYKQINSSQ